MSANNRTELATNGADKHDVSIYEGMERVLVGGDLSQLSTEQRLAYYRSRCEVAGLDPRARPFEYVKIKGVLKLYATKECTDQLNAIHGISHAIVGRGMVGDDLYECQVIATTKAGRSTPDVGVVPYFLGAPAEERANAIMRAVTKAKRRSTLGLCGMGDVIDESELDTVKAEIKPTVAAPTNLNEQLRARLNKPTQQPGDLTGMNTLGAQQRVTEERAREPKPEQLKPSTDWGRYIADGVERFNNEVAKVSDDTKFRLSVQQVINHIAKIAVGNQEELKTGGKQDRIKVKAFLQSLWDANSQDVIDMCDQYLEVKLGEVPRPVEASEAASIADDGEAFGEGRE